MKILKILFLGILLSAQFCAKFPTFDEVIVNGIEWRGLEEYHQSSDGFINEANCKSVSLHFHTITNLLLLLIVAALAIATFRAVRFTETTHTYHSVEKKFTLQNQKFSLDEALSLLPYKKMIFLKIVKKNSSALLIFETLKWSTLIRRYLFKIHYHLDGRHL
ncbi:hypothetical protein T05_10740 [Trichinella murrelli]|uniref:Uncharacterized protein n=1 Tax=Trichinella murrelli TaxID=144512 RepID=A0A0V0TW99_9BILA|nr:hypothetical protein T05_10740 [Trichinella murrelli]